MATVADVIVQHLRTAGVRALFGVPGGGGNLDLIEAAGLAGLPFVLTATETGGAIAAMAQAEITGVPGACLTTLGPGATSVVTGVACAYLDRAPLVVFTDSYPVSADGAFEHQQLDQASLFAPITTLSRRLTPETVMQTMSDALHAAVGPPPGPAHVECPGDAASAAAPGVSLTGHVIPAELVWTPAEQSRLTSLLERSRKPLLLVGLGARREEDATAIRALCERHRVPAMVTYKAKGVVPDGHPLFAGVFTNAAIERPIADESDLLIGIGLDPVELLPRRWSHAQPIIYCGPWAVEDRHVPFALQVVGNVPAAVQAIGAALRPSDWDPDVVRAHVDEQQRKISVHADGLTAQSVIRVAAARLAHGGRVTVDAGAHMFPATMLWPVDEPNGMLVSNGLSTMGFALPAAIGAALLDRSRPVVALTGDGGLLMCLGELLTAVRERVRVIVIVFSDASLSLIEIKQQQRHLRPAGVALGSIAWPALARGFGVPAFLASTEEELDRAIDQALACAGPSLIEARIDRSNYGQTLKAVRG